MKRYVCRQENPDCIKVTTNHIIFKFKHIQLQNVSIFLDKPEFLLKMDDDEYIMYEMMMRMYYV